MTRYEKGVIIYEIGSSLLGFCIFGFQPLKILIFMFVLNVLFFPIRRILHGSSR
jgi:hypothetical protein